MANEIWIDGVKLTSVDQIEELKDILNEGQDNRLLKCVGGSAAVLVTQDNVLVSNGANYINVNQRGTTIDGKVHLATEPGKIRINGFWTLNDELLTTLPSTIYTPIPVLNYDTPPAVENIQKMVKFLQGLI